MRTILIIVFALTAVVAVSGFFHHHHENHRNEDHEENNHHNEDHNENEEHKHRHTGGGDHEKHKHHHHHNKDHKHKKHHWQCKDEPINKNEELIKAKNECRKEFKEAKDNDVSGRQKGRVCKSVCSGKKFGFFDKDGQIVQSKADELIDSMIVNTEAQTEIKERAAECATNSSTALLGGPSDIKCSNYKPYLKCVWLSFMEVCVKNFDPEEF